MTDDEQITFDRPPAVVLLPFPETGMTGLGVIRALGEWGVPVVAVSPEKCPLSFRSRYVARTVVSRFSEFDGEAFGRWLAKLGRRLRPKAVLFATSDVQAAVLSLFQGLLEDAFHYPFLSNRALKASLDKRQTCEIAVRAGVGAPITIAVHDKFRVEEVLGRIGFPAIVKPAMWVRLEKRHIVSHRAFLERFGAKAVRASGPDALANIVGTASSLDVPIIIQEEIPGPSAHIYGASVYADRDCQTRAIFVGRKTRQFPSDFGSGTMVENTSCPRVAELSHRIILHAEFRGVAELEFKFDQRDDQYKIMEINPRPGTWISVAPASGVNTPYAAYQDLLGKPVPQYRQTDRKVVWVDAWTDLEYLYHYRKGDHTGHSLSVWDYLRSLRGWREWAYWRLADPVPSFIRLKAKLIEMLSRISKKIARSLLRGTFAHGKTRRTRVGVGQGSANGE